MSPVGIIIQNTTTPFPSPALGSHFRVSDVFGEKRTKTSSRLVSMHSNRCSGFDSLIKEHSLSFKAEPSSQRSKGEPLLRQFSVASTSFLGENLDASLHRRSFHSDRRQGPLPPRAYMYFPHEIPYPKVTEKPKWWWRTLACVPYLMALQISDTGFYFHPLMERYEQFEFLSYYIPGAIRRLPSWFLMVVWYASNFMPLIHYSGTYGPYYWAIVGFAYVLLLSECVRNALAGIYVNIPFVSDAAYMHTPYVKGEL